MIPLQMVHEKFGKEFGVREDSVYNGLLKEAKARKKPVVLGQTLGLKMKDIVDEALKASGNPVSFYRNVFHLSVLLVCALFWLLAFHCESLLTKLT